MPNIINTLLPLFGGDSVLVTDQNGNQVFKRAKAMKAEVRPQSRPMEHPLEYGSIITDHRILLPIEIELSLVLQSADYKDTYKEIAHYYATGILLIVQCKAGNFTNQLIQSIPHMEDADHMDALVLAMKLKQVLIAQTTQTMQVITENPTNTTTVDRGTQNPVQTTPDLNNSALIAANPYVRAPLPPGPPPL